MFGDAFDCDAVMESSVQDRLLCGGIAAFDCDAVMGSRFQDRLLYGGGVARVLYLRHFGDEIAPQRIARGGAAGSNGRWLQEGRCPTQFHCSSTLLRTAGAVGFFLSQSSASRGEATSAGPNLSPVHSWC